MAREHLDRLLTQVAEHVGLSNITLDGEGYCSLEVDEKMIVHMKYNQDLDQLILFSEIGEVRDEEKIFVYKALLNYNAQVDDVLKGTLAKMNAENNIFFQKMLDVEALSAENLQEALESFIDKVKEWGEKFIGLTQVAEM